MSLNDLCENDCDEEWHALAPEEWLECVTTIKAMAGIHEDPMNAYLVACCSKLMEPKGAAENFMALLEAGIWLSVIICDGDITAIDEIRKAIQRSWPGIDPAVREALPPELKACINHKVKNMGCAAVSTRSDLVAASSVMGYQGPCIHHQA